VELADDNGGVVLNVCERGLAMRAVRTLGDDQFTQLRFQLSQANDWIETRGRITWMNALRTIVGVEFVDLSYEGRILLENWISSLEMLDATAGKNSLAENARKAERTPASDQPAAAQVSISRPDTAKSGIEHLGQDSAASRALFTMHAGGPELGRQAPTESSGIEEKSVDGSPATAEPEGFVSVPETETIRRVAEDRRELASAQDSVGTPPSEAEARSEANSNSSTNENDRSATIENKDYRVGSPFALSYGDGSREIESGEGSTSPGRSSRGTWIWVVAALVLLACVLLAFHFRMTPNNRPPEGSIVATKGAELPTDNSANPTKPSVSPNPPSIGHSFVLQVAAMTHKDNADRLAESLRNRNFPAFVSHSATDQFYRVIVGPYETADSTSKVRKELEKENFKVIRKQWNPASIQDSDRAQNH
jgi:septal ring-binding cell division protein DamX